MQRQDSLFFLEINHRVFQIHQLEGGVAIRFLSARRHEPPCRNELIVWKTDSPFFSHLARPRSRA